MCKSAYVHVPFCKDICSYCDFTRCRYHEGLANQWLCVIEQEIKEKLNGIDLHTLYLGGGTPSALTLTQLTQLLNCLSPYTACIEEYTMEANIESFDNEKIKLARAFGVNRISLGVQSLQPSLLKLIHRHHQREDVFACIERIHQHGIHNISIDMIYGLPSQTMQMWKDDLQDIIKHGCISHISLYALTIEEHSEFGRKGIVNIDEDIEADMYEYAVDFLKQQGFVHYEISSFAKPGMESRHNLTYWRYDDFIGIGLGASGKQRHVRYDNTKNMQVYFEHGASPQEISLTKEDEMFEMIMMSLRTSKGLNRHLFQKRYGVEIAQRYPQTIQRYLEKGMLCMEEGFLRVNEAGMELLHDILVSFMEES